MRVVELVDRSAAVALEHASALQEHLRAVGSSEDAGIGQCRAEMHRLLGDIVSLRNAAELLKREAAAGVGRGELDLPGPRRTTAEAPAQRTLTA